MLARATSSDHASKANLRGCSEHMHGSRQGLFAFFDHTFSHTDHTGLRVLQDGGLIRESAFRT